MTQEEKELQLTRRSLLGLSTAFVASLPFATLLGDSVIAQEANPTRGGVLKFNMNGDPPSFDLMGNSTSWVVTMVGPCYNGLIQFDPLAPDQIIGDLATSWDVSEDGRTYTFHLTPGVLFHDGMPLTSADAKFTFDVMRAPPDGYTSIRKNTLQAVESIETPDDVTVVFNLNGPSPAFLTMMAGGLMLVQPKHILEKGPMAEIVVGSGPFKFHEYVRGVSLELIRNENYHVPDRPYLDGMKMFIIPDPGTVLAHFRSEQIDLYEDMPIETSRLIAAEFPDQLDVQSAPGMGSLGILYNLSREPWSDPRVRKAASLAVDRQALVNVMFRGDAVVSGVSFPGKWSLSEAELATIPGYGLTQAPDALEQARTLLKEAGVENGFKTKILTRNIARFEPFGVFLKDQWAKIGIDATVDLQETAIFNERMAAKDFEVNAGGASLAFNDPNAVFAPFLCDDPNNQTTLCSDEIDRLYAQQAVELDPEKRKALANELEKLVLSEYARYHMCFTKRFQGVGKHVHGYLLHNIPDNNKRHQNVWIG